jgi:hypothetical protein
MEDVHEEWVANPRQNYIQKGLGDSKSDSKGEAKSDTIDSSRAHQESSEIEESSGGHRESSEGCEGGSDQRMESIIADTHDFKLCSSSSVTQPQPVVKKRKRRKQTCKEAVEPVISHRLVKQLFVRGDNIVMVSPLKLAKPGR